MSFTVEKRNGVDLDEKTVMHVRQHPRLNCVEARPVFHSDDISRDALHAFGPPSGRCQNLKHVLNRLRCLRFEAVVRQRRAVGADWQLI